MHGCGAIDTLLEYVQMNRAVLLRLRGALGPYNWMEWIRTFFSLSPA